MQTKITKDDIFIFLKNSGKAIGSLTLNAYGESLNQIGEKAFLNAIEIGIENTIATLYDANVNDKEILRVVVEHWGIPIQEVEDRLVWEKQQATIRSLKQYLRLQGKTITEINTFIIEEKVSIKVRYHTELWKLKNNPEKLMKELKAIR